MALEYLRKFFPNWVTPDVIKAWASVLYDIPAPMIVNALQKWVQENDKMPTVANIRGMCGMIPAKPDINLECTEMWLKEIKREVSRVGHYGEPKFDNPTVAKTVELLGWRNLCLQDEDEARKSFIYTYKSYREQEEAQKKVLPMIGEMEKMRMLNENN